MINKKLPQCKKMLKTTLILSLFLSPIMNINAESSDTELKPGKIEIHEMTEVENEIIRSLTPEESEIYYSLYDDIIISGLLSTGIKYYNLADLEQAINTFTSILEINELSNPQEIVLKKLISDISEKKEFEDADFNFDEQKDRINTTNLMKANLTADELYEKAVGASGATPAWNAALQLKRLYPQDSRIDEAIKETGRRQLILGMSNHRKEDFNKANEYYNRILNESSIDERLRIETDFYRNQSMKKQKIRTADVLYEEAMTAPGATPAWNTAQKLKEIFPDDSRLSVAINATANRQLILGMSRHRLGNYEGAKEYYNRILSEQLINNTVRELTTIYLKQANNRQVLLTADDLFNDAMTAQGATPAWNAAQRLSELYPQDSRISTAINTAGRRQLILGMSNHRQNNYDKANEYYVRVLNETLINDAIRTETNFYRNQALKKQAIQTADDLFNDAMNGAGATPAWNAAQKLKEIFPTDSRVSTAIQETANRQLILGMSSHREGRFTNANEYYNRILSESLINKAIREATLVYSTQATNKQELRTAEDVYNDVMIAPGATPAWNRAQELKRLFPSSNLVVVAVNTAAERLFILGKDSHIKSDFNQAIHYYDRILGESLVNSQLSSFVTNLKAMAQKKEQIQSASVFYENSIKSLGATPAWNIAREGLKLYPENKEILSALNKAANRILILGRQQQKQGDYLEARSYYNRVINDKNVDQSIATLATVFNNQLNFNHSPIVFIDPGHGGTDPGAVHSRTSEKTLNLNTSTYIKTELESKGYNVIMSRNTDAFLELIERAEAANEKIADIFISVHYNSMGGSGLARGIETFIHHRVDSGFGQETRRANFKTDDIRIKESLDLADAIHSNLISSTGMYNRGVKGNNYSVLRNTDIPAVLLELGFMDNSSELSRIKTTTYQRQAARAVANGIDEYFKYLK